MTSMKMEYIKRIKGSRHISDVNKAVKALLKDLGYPERNRINSTFCMKILPTLP